MEGPVSSRADCAAGGAERTEFDVGRFVRDRLYGEGSGVTATSVAEFRAELLTANGSSAALARREAACRFCAPEITQRV
jgi:hypothetical protein